MKCHSSDFPNKDSPSFVLISWKNRFLVGSYTSICLFLIMAIFLSTCLFRETTEFQSQITEDLRKFKIHANDLWKEILRTRIYISIATDSQQSVREKREEAAGCSCSEICPPGPPGPAGPEGIPGFPGIPGPDGSHGLSGDQLNMETKECIKCPQGAPGIQGTPGSAGLPGNPGPRGLDGSIGIAGPPGPPGLQGSAGLPGSSGILGEPGVPGSNGIRRISIPGPPGQPGPQGSQGPPGEDAAIVPPPPIGPPGQPGTPGSPGNPGRDGIAGPQGSAGAPGSDAAYCACPPRTRQDAYVQPEAPKMQENTYTYGERKGGNPMEPPSVTYVAKLPVNFDRYKLGNSPYTHIPFTQ